MGKFEIDNVTRNLVEWPLIHRKAIQVTDWTCAEWKLSGGGWWLYFDVQVWGSELLDLGEGGKKRASKGASHDWHLMHQSGPTSDAVTLFQGYVQKLFLAEFPTVDLTECYMHMYLTYLA